MEITNGRRSGHYCYFISRHTGKRRKLRKFRRRQKDILECLWTCDKKESYRDYELRKKKSLLLLYFRTNERERELMLIAEEARS